MAIFGVGEIGHRAPQKIRGRNEIGVEDGDEFAGRGFQPFLQRARLESFAIVAMDVGDGNAEGLVAFDAIARDLLCLIGGIVEHLDVEQLARVIELRDGLDQPLDHVALVVDRELDRHLGPDGDFGRRPGNILAILEIVVDQRVAMHAVHRQNCHHEEVRQHDGEVESVRLIEAAEGRINQPSKIDRDRVAASRDQGGQDV